MYSVNSQNVFHVVDIWRI